MAMAVFLPATLSMDFLTAMLFLTSIFTGGQFGGGVSAILMNIPGTSSAVATTFDGFPMARQGRHNEALGVALMASTVGTVFGYVVLLILIKPLSTAVLKLGPTEMFVVILRSEEHTSELQSLMRISYAVFCLKKKKKYIKTYINHIN